MKGTRARLAMLLACCAVASLATLAPSQPEAPNVTLIKPGINVLDKETERTGKLWSLHFRFKDVRLIKANIPGKGTRICWYMWYQVINHTGEPRTFIPQFELVTTDTRMNYVDQVVPAAQEEINKLFPYDKLRNSVTIAREPIPVSLPMADPRPVTGVAIWIDPYEPSPDDDEKERKFKESMKKLADSNAFTVYVTGLSNGFTTVDGDASDPRPVVVRKTLRLPFRRLGDKLLMKTDAIRYTPTTESPWLYRASKIRLDLPAAPGAGEKPAEQK